MINICKVFSITSYQGDPYVACDTINLTITGHKIITTTYITLKLYVKKLIWGHHIISGLRSVCHLSQPFFFCFCLTLASLALQEILHTLTAQSKFVCVTPEQIHRTILC